jgi:chromosome segregation ATPase
VPRLRQEVDHLRREVAQLRRNNADTLSVATPGNATPIMSSPDLAQLKGRIETLEKDLRDTRKKRRHSVKMCNDPEALCKAQDDELKNLRNRVRDLTNTDQARDKAMMRTQREHSQVAKKVTEIESCLAKANAEKVRLRKNVKESTTAAAAAAAELQAQLDVERQVTLEMKVAKNDKRTLKKQLARAQDKAAQGMAPKLRSCSVIEFNKKTPEARRKASQRDRDMWSDVLNGNQRLEGLASELKSQGRLDELFDVKELYEMHIGKMNEIMRRIEEDHYGVDFGLFLHYEMSLPLHKILRITHAGSHQYDKDHDHYMRKAILCSGNGSTGQFSVKVPRIGLPRNVLEPVMRKLEDSLGVETREDGCVAFLEFDKALADIVN